MGEHFKELLNCEDNQEERVRDAPEEVEEDQDINLQCPTMDEIRIALKTLKNTKAPGLDNIAPELLKADIESTVKMLHPSLKHIWLEEKSLKEWENGLVVELPKKGNLSDCNNWRGITLLSVPTRFITFVSAYAPTLDSDEDTKNQFYHQLNSTLSKIPIQDKLILLGDFNARMGRDNRFWREVMGKQGVVNCNANGLLLLGLCAEHELFISNTQFRLRNRYKTTWMHPRSKHWHLIDYVITRQRDKKDILITKAALNIDECWADHILLVSRLRVPKYRKPRSHFSNPPRRKFNISNLNNKNVRSHFQDILSEQLNKAPATTDDVEQEWTTLKNIIKETAENVVGFSARKRSDCARKRSDWFDDNHGEIQAIINAKRDAYLSLAQDPSCAEKKAHFQELKQKCQSKIRVIKNKWWQQKATELQNLSDARNLRGFYAGIKELYGPIRSSSGTLKAADNSTILTESQDILNRWKEHFSSLLNRPSTAARDFLKNVPQHPPKPWMADPPTFQEFCKALKSVKPGKAAGPDSIPMELTDGGGLPLKTRLFSLILLMWETRKLQRNVINLQNNKEYLTKNDDVSSPAPLIVNYRAGNDSHAATYYQAVDKRLQISIQSNRLGEKIKYALLHSRL
ncbi:uncharacterized protein LOC124788611 [Schistocerca piceifrons]|uniref:uncharacterized protein LOC124788611 n=1 Tax=Schistocerca piceifrons TaxID=274613 RepID=UPI001F5EF0CC|nr:uncharacterized protein LOC124788611 [Schistocerca piceifrons]